MRAIQIIAALLTLLVTAEAENQNCKHNIRCNMMHNYYELPPEVTNIKEMFSEGMYYGRVRMNSFGYQWGEELSLPNGLDIRKDHRVAALGGSLIYKSAYLNGFSFMAGLYGSQAQGNLDDTEGYLYKAGKGTLNREDLLEGKSSILSLAEGYLEYKYEKTSLRAGRQIFESFLTKSNDTKMIPNTFEGVTLHTNEIKNIDLNLAYFHKQKLRDHSNFHSVFAYGYDGQNLDSVFTENDDSAMHRGILKTELDRQGIKDRLLVVELRHTAIDNLMLLANYTAVPDLIASVMMQADYRFEVGVWSVIPGLRYMQQFDQGAGAIGGANLQTVTQGYNNPESLDSDMFAARVDVVQDAFKLRFAMTQIADKGDLVAPWRGFPTAGFTRAMAQYNWYANTKSYMVQLDYEFEFVENLKILSRYVIQDFDDHKEGVQADSNVFTFDIAKRFEDAHMIFKTRYAHVTGKAGDIVFEDGFRKLNPSYDEIRFEINYLF
ncbi:MAG: outer membrane porin, OprD family [Sulfurovum sp.]|nr:outer membrane porin, OprD family [Sulfurovum sp.]